MNDTQTLKDIEESENGPGASSKKNLIDTRCGTYTNMPADYATSMHRRDEGRENRNPFDTGYAMAWITTEIDEKPSSFVLKAPLSGDELRCRRNEDWRIDHDEGRYDPAYRRTVRRSLALIAKLYRVDQATVLRGIQSARRLHAELADVEAKNAC